MGVALGDLTMNPLMIFFFLFVLMAALLVPRAKLNDDTEPPPQLGKLHVEIEWPPGNTDIDLWILPPGAAKPVGFSNRGGPACDLLRDDLGTANDPMPSNRESIMCRAAPAGEYTITAYYYASSILEGPVPISVIAIISLWNDRLNRYERVHTTTVELAKPKEYATIASFLMQDDGTIDTGSFNTIERNIFEKR
ncbi:hypothetical protein A3C87_00740 [Candidatus Kaiserbacteria bacterium RIFCSPHIGHO2_02_FULL_49_34]|uniref:DUF2135 domain-containing protein n=1 Tax=Candidatus Kaiserbacteria bacterium RIFCSPHIGHO2_02_FULL_49_34 TaxID=1798491 RepID=A0A1F6DKF9_9BACT|nr:MAG: hypothetical protein A3C87_00740 [Candidatus Kaiserbacteria bacterium RIFCSPHIGHO2_02_FULL_49_34]